MAPDSVDLSKHEEGEKALSRKKKLPGREEGKSREPAGESVRQNLFDRPEKKGLLFEKRCEEKENQSTTRG